MWLTRLALHNPILILMVSIGAIVLGGTAVQRLPVDLFPSISPPLVQVATFYSGASPTDSACVEPSSLRPDSCLTTCQCPGAI